MMIKIMIADTFTAATSKMKAINFAFLDLHNKSSNSQKKHSVFQEEPKFYGHISIHRMRSNTQFQSIVSFDTPRRTIERQKSW